MSFRICIPAQRFLASCLLWAILGSADEAIGIEQAQGLKWWMCPDAAAPPSISSACIEAAVPGTVFTTLVRNGTYGFADPYFNKNLQQVPDISQVGRDAYTRWFMVDLTPVRNRIASSSKRFIWLHIHGINYRSTIFIDGQSVGTTLGMFRRFTFSLSDSMLTTGPSLLQVRVEPPLYPGKNKTGKCHGGKWPAGQGGDHELAKSGPIMQMSAGWDWIQATPDRNTGIWDRVELLTTGPVRLVDPFVRTQFTSSGRYAAMAGFVDRADMSLSASVDVIAAAPATGVAEFRLLDADGADVVLHKVPFSVEQGHSIVQMPPRIIHNAFLWWPHAFGQPYLYSLSITLRLDDGSVSDETQFRIGFREFKKYVDSSLEGPVFSVNGQRVFLRGGNWIGTDQFLRYVTDLQRYRDEIGLHVEMGLDMLRVWGGGIAERDAFYEVCDELGMLVWQEFWMTGDNNGRWAGEYSWPEDHTLYTLAVTDVVHRLRKHASLLIWVAGNELDPTSENPPSDIREVMQTLFDEDDRPFAFSSMTNHTHFNASIHMAPKDGPYGMLALEEMFTRNPGLTFWNKTRADQLKIAFQPELGSSSCPVFTSLKRFLAQDALAIIPDARDKVQSAWAWHNYEGYSASLSPTANSTNLVYNLGVPSNASEFALRAQIVQFMQYRTLFEGFSQFMWTYYSGVLMWKTQSPWPSLRGFLYDWYLHPTGGFYGVREATKRGHAQLDFLTRRIHVVNRALGQHIEGTLRTESFFLNGSRAGPSTLIPVNVSFNSVAEVGQEPRHSELTILRFSLQPKSEIEPSVSEYMVPVLPSDFSGLAVLREPAMMQHLLAASLPRITKTSFGCKRYRQQQHHQLYGAQVEADPMCFSDTMKVKLTAQRGSRACLFVHAVPLDADGEPILPHACDAGYVHILPGEKRLLRCSAREHIAAIRIDGWNVFPLTINALMEDAITFV